MVDGMPWEKFTFVKPKITARPNTISIMATILWRIIVRGVMFVWTPLILFCNSINLIMTGRRKIRAPTITNTKPAINWGIFLY